MNKKHKLVIHRVVLESASGVTPGMMARAAIAVAEALDMTLTDVAFKHNDMLYGVSIETKELEIRNTVGKQ